MKLTGGSVRGEVRDEPEGRRMRRHPSLDRRLFSSSYMSVVVVGLDLDEDLDGVALLDDWSMMDRNVELATERKSSVRSTTMGVGVDRIHRIQVDASSRSDNDPPPPAPPPVAVAVSVAECSWASRSVIRSIALVSTNELASSIHIFPEEVVSPAPPEFLNTSDLYMQDVARLQISVNGSSYVVVVVVVEGVVVAAVVVVFFKPSSVSGVVITGVLGLLIMAGSADTDNSNNLSRLLLILISRIIARR